MLDQPPHLFDFEFRYPILLLLLFKLLIERIESLLALFDLAFPLPQLHPVTLLFLIYLLLEDHLILLELFKICLLHHLLFLCLLLLVYYPLLCLELLYDSLELLVLFLNLLDLLCLELPGLLLLVLLGLQLLHLLLPDSEFVHESLHLGLKFLLIAHLLKRFALFLVLLLEFLYLFLQV